MSTHRPSKENRAHSFEYDVEVEDLDLVCPICYRVFILPESTPCKHTFCSKCIRESLHKVAKNCPLCKGDVSVAQLVPTRGKLRSTVEAIPVVCAHHKEGCSFKGTRAEYASHVEGCGYEAQWAALESERFLAAKQFRLDLFVGNTHTAVTATTQNKHEWMVFVRAADGDVSRIKSVTFHLHPTFRPKSVVVPSAPFQMRRLGWGTFAIHIEIMCVDGTRHRVVHELSFDRPVEEEPKTLLFGHPAEDWTESDLY